MDISPQAFKDIQSFFRTVDEEPNYECEVRFKHTISKEAFTRVFQYASGGGFTSLGDSSVLDISLENDPAWKGYRLHMSGGSDAVVSYCKTGRLPASGITVDRKLRVEDRPAIMLDEYQLKIDLKQEEPIEDPALTENFRKAVVSGQTLKHYRYKKRYSFQRDHFRLDLTALKEPRDASRNVAHSGLFQVRDTYEVELEYVKLERPIGSYPEIIRAGFGIIGHILKALTEKHILLKVSEMDAIRKSYVRLITGDTKVDMTRAHRYNMGPQPVTLEKQDALPIGASVHTIRQGYTVTEKADGLRHLMYIADNGRAYLVNKQLDITFTGLAFEKKSCVLDGELLRTGRKGIPLFQFMVFDIYVYEGRKVMDLPFVGATGETRLQLAGTVLGSRPTKLHDIGLTVQLKDFIMGGSTPEEESKIFKATQVILDKDRKQQYLYEIDGVIFTPMGPIDKSVRFFKWKPADERTFDLRVRYIKGANNVTLEGYPGQYQLAKLYVGAAFATELNPVDILENRAATTSNNNKQRYGEREFATCHLPVDTGNKVIATKTREAIDDGAIVEFCYSGDKALPDSLRWVPKLIRHDKYKTGPNDFRVANSVLQSILVPLTPEMITGAEPIEMEGDAGSSSYYQAGVENRADSELKPMLDFHNAWVKKHHLLMRFKGKATRLFDMGVGRGADMSKWVDAGFTQVVGVDYSADNVFSSDPALGSAYTRYSEEVKKGRLRPSTNRMLFMVMDASQLWTPDYVASLLPAENEYLAKVVFGSRIAEKQIKEASLRPFYKSAERGFQVVSCQFAIHYFFKNAETLSSFCENVKSVIAPGGYLVGTCFDGFLVHQKLAALPRGGDIRALDANGRIMWKITKDYESGAGAGAELGRCIQNYNSRIGKAFDEYLVDYGLLCERMAAVAGLHPLTPAECRDLGLAATSGTFEELHQELRAHVRGSGAGASTSVSQTLRNAAENMSSKQCEYSFLNRWFIFRRPI